MSITVTAGGAATAAQFNALVPVYLAQGSDQALATTTFTAHNTFAAIAVGAGQVWQVEVNFSVSSANAGNGVKFRWAFTGDATGSRRHILSLAAAVTDVINQNVNLQCRQSTASVSGGTAAVSDPSSWQEKLVVSGGVAGGTYGVEWAQSAAVSGSTTLNAAGATWLLATRLS